MKEGMKGGGVRGEKGGREETMEEWGGRINHS